MTNAQLIDQILALDPTARKGRLRKTRKAGLEARLRELEGAAGTATATATATATVDVIPMECPDCGKIHSNTALERSGGRCPQAGRPAPAKPVPAKPVPAKPVPGKPGTHQWTPAFETRTTKDDDHACLLCGTRVRNLATGTDGPCEPPRSRTLTVKGIKFFQGMEGSGFNASLYEDGKRLGLVIDEATGGPLLYRIPHAKVEELNRWARVEQKDAYQETLDILVGELVAKADEEKRLKRLCRGKTVAKMEGDPKDSYTTWRRPYSAEFAATLRRQHGDKIVEFINERFL